MKTADVCPKHGISTATFYDGRQKFGGMEVAEAQRLKQLKDENRRLKLLVAVLSLHREVLKTVMLIALFYRGFPRNSFLPGMAIAA